MWSEVRCGLHEAVWRGEVSGDRALAILERVEASPVQARTHANLGREAWRIADDLGWAKTYDAEYVALASLLGCRLVTLDGRLLRGTERLGFVIGPAELDG
jgi:predicted nucleic acid-binding protein